MSKVEEKKAAVILRRQGKSYSEILALVPVTKASLSLWLRNITLDKAQKERLIAKKRAAQMLGAKRKRELRIVRTEKIKTEAASEICSFDKNILKILGVALYWAEGSKQKVHNISQRVTFCNSDQKMVAIFYNWLIKICHVSLEEMYFEIYIHQEANIDEARKFWSATLGLSKELFSLIRYKKGNPKSYRKNKGNNYHGLLRITVRRSTALNRKIAGWIEGIYQNGIAI